MELRDGDLVLRPWTEDDVAALVAGCNDPDVAWWIPTIPSPYSDDGCAGVHPRRGRAGRAELRDDSPRRVVGGIGLSVDDQAYRGTIGYWVAAHARGQGTCTRALRLLSRFALDELELQRLELVTDPDNVASQRVAEKVGFQREGVLRSHLRHPDGRIRDSVMFSLLPGELRE